jgi:N-acetylglucosaminyl-diphospho-decaprenol L-rhamnosyltransferase
VAEADLSIVVVTWRSATRLRGLIESIDVHLGDAPELVVVENGSGEDPEPTARRYRGRLRFTSLDPGVGFGQACNVGVQGSSAPATVLLNPDCELVDASLASLAGVALRRRALAGPRVLSPDGSIQPSASGPPTGPWPWIGALVPGRVQPAAVRAHTEPWRLERTTDVAWLTGACIAAPRDMLLALGPFDPSIGLYAEDMDLGLRARARGVPSLFCPDVSRLVHHGGASTALALSEAEAARLAAQNRRAVVRRAAGVRGEQLAWLAQRTNLRLRVVAKGALGIGHDGERIALAATRAARSAEEIPAPPSGRHGTGDA